VEVAPLHTPYSVAQGYDYASLLHKFEDLSRRVANLTSGRTRHRTHSRDRCKANDVPSPANGSAGRGYCRYHQRFGNKAKRCTPPCSFRQQEKGNNRFLMVADVDSTKPGRLFITDKFSNLRFWSIPVLTSACLPEGSSQVTISAPATISSQPMIHPFQPTDSTISCLTSDFDGISPAFRGGRRATINHQGGPANFKLFVD